MLKKSPQSKQIYLKTKIQTNQQFLQHNLLTNS